VQNANPLHKFFVIIELGEWFPCRPLRGDIFDEREYNMNEKRITHCRTITVAGLTVVLSIAFVLICFVGCDRFSLFRGDSPPKTVLIGLDGGTWDMILPLVKKGELPNVAQMMKEGVYGNLLSDPPYSPPSWTSIATGKTPDHHGIHDFVKRDYRDPADENGPYDLVPIESTSIRTARIWDVLSYHNLKSAVCYYLFTWPVEQFQGVVISDFRGKGEDFLQYRFIQDEVYEAFTRSWYLDGHLRIMKEPGDTLILENTPEEFRSRDKRVADELLKIEQIISTSRYILREYPELDFFTTTFYWGNYMQHEFMHYLFPEYYRIGESESERYGEVIPMLYRTFDDFIGTLMEDSSIDAIMIVSDHGMEPLRWEDETSLNCYHFYILLNRFLEEFGFYVKKPGSDEMDPAKTLAFEVAYRRTEKGVALNSREWYPSQGKTLSFRERTKIKNDLIKKFSEIRFVNTGEPVFGKVYENPEGWPDIIFDEYVTFPYGKTREVFSSEITVNGRKFPLNEFIKYTGYNIRAEHGYDFNGKKPYGENGIFLFSGPQINRNKNINLRTIDVLPNLLYSLALPVGEDMDGEVRKEIFTSGFKKKHPLETVDSYDEYTEKKFIEVRPSQYYGEMMNRLKSLGYVQ
jgi:predicted AlkP superfamily phosphohydrolase/phosphomutase